MFVFRRVIPKNFDGLRPHILDLEATFMFNTHSMLHSLPWWLKKKSHNVN